ncbi:large ribosomal subunit protein mL49 isoform X1 [Dendrobates tinctorius]|uniref:large ribosomal subunit protein mL49 isoform X1 n=1 Tax=Dendrobates tinctorius TaxID=92724 RepID=UPI003CC9C42F
MAAPILRRTALRALNAVSRLQRPCSGSAASASSQYPGIIESHEEFHFVERLIPPTQVPKPPKHTAPAPSGWIPPKDTLPDLPYVVRRSRMHNIPVYTDITHGNRHMTIIRKIEGDLWHYCSYWGRLCQVTARNAAKPRRALENQHWPLKSLATVSFRRVRPKEGFTHAFFFAMIVASLTWQE